MKFAAAVLAAGGSSRLGEPKQLLRYRGQTLVRRAALLALGAEAEPVLIITGADAPLVEREVADLPVRIIRNEQWEEGMATSVHAAVRGAGTDPLLLLLCDQPRVTEEDVKMLMVEHERGASQITAAAYEGTVGAPAIFSAATFGELLELRGDHGAKPVIERDPSRVSALPMPSAAADVDRPDDARSIESDPD
jgi:molybdenum cofactor cytidylyltransferase